MFEKIGRAAEAAASGVVPTRRGFFSRLARLAGGAALGIAALAAKPAKGDVAVDYCTAQCGRVPCYCYVPGYCCNGNTYCLRYRPEACRRYGAY